MAVESWVLDGVSLNGGNFALLELNADPPSPRPMWVSSVDTESAALVRDPLFENRLITMKLRVTPQASMNAALDQVGALRDKMAKASASAPTSSGIPLVWAPASSTRSVTFDVLLGEITGLPIALSDEGYSWLLRQPIVTVTMTCAPYWRAAEVLTGTASSGTTPVVTLEVASVPGDVEALGRIIVTDSASQSRRHVEYGIESSPTYNASTSLLVDSDDMVTSGFSGAQATTSGAFDPNASGNNSVSLTLVAGAVTAMCGTGNLSHVGSFRVKARMQCGSADNLFRLSWKSLDGPTSHNDWVSPIVAGTDWQELDLGMITVLAATSGTQRWTGQIEVGSATSSPGTAIVDYLVLMPVLTGYGVARAALAYSSGISTAFDAFAGTTAGAALGTRAAPLGGSWATSGDATDFAFSDNGFGAGSEELTRSANSSTNGRTALLGTTAYADTQLDVDLKIDEPPSGGDIVGAGAFARWVDATHYVLAQVNRFSGGVATLQISAQIATGVFGFSHSTAAFPVTSGATYRLRLLAYASGRAIAQLFSAGVLVAAIEGSDAALATGGAIDDGRVGIWDFKTGSGTTARYYASVSASTPAPEPIALYSGKTLQFRYDGAIRDDATGTYTGRPQIFEGSYVLIPPGTSRVIVKARRNDVLTTGDPNISDATTIQIGYTPRGLVVPR